MHTSRAWTIAIGALVYAAIATGTEAGAFRAPSSGERLRANEPYAVSWSFESGALAKRDEMELILSLDDGVTFPIRVTGELSTDARTLTWRVPALATEHAVLALRAGEDEKSDREEILAVSEPFAVVADPETPLEPLYPVADEWRTGDALDGAPVRAPSGKLASTNDGPELSSIDDDADESETPPVTGAGAAPSDAGAIAKTPPRRRPANPTRIATSLLVPLRL